jgi:hypothetical protein
VGPTVFLIVAQRHEPILRKLETNTAKIKQTRGSVFVRKYNAQTSRAITGDYENARRTRVYVSSQNQSPVPASKHYGSDPGFFW